MTPKSSPRPPNTSLGHPRTAQELPQTAPDHPKRRPNIRPKRSRPPEATKSAKKFQINPQKPMGYPNGPGFWTQPGLRVGPVTKLLLYFLLGAVAVSQLSCALGSAAPGLLSAHGVQKLFQKSETLMAKPYVITIMGRGGGDAQEASEASSATRSGCTALRSGWQQEH